MTGQAEQEVAKEIKKAIGDIDLRDLSTTDHLLRWGRACEALAVRLMRYKQGVEKAEKKLKWDAKVDLAKQWALGVNHALETLTRHTQEDTP